MAGVPITWMMIMMLVKAIMVTCAPVEHSRERSTRSHDVPSSSGTQ